MRLRDFPALISCLRGGAGKSPTRGPQTNSTECEFRFAYLLKRCVHDGAGDKHDDCRQQDWKPKGDERDHALPPWEYEGGLDFPREATPTEEASHERLLNFRNDQSIPETGPAGARSR